MPYTSTRRLIHRLGAALALLGCLLTPQALAQAKVIQTPYQNPKALVDINLDDPRKLASALSWVRGLINPLIEAPYSIFPEDMDIIVLMRGTTIVTLARKNEERYQEVVQRMRYYASMGVKFKVCGQALQEFQYSASDLYDFVEVTPSTITELMYWQNQGYALISVTVNDKKFTNEQIR